ncbi:Nn.00g019140.m01.CDS01 [Neocucurbitaria sp. VM-36]
MDPFRNAALQNAKFRSLFQPSQQSTTRSTTSEDMPAPPAYHMVVDPNAPVPSVASPYEPQIEEEEKDDSEMPEITINAATQIRGNGNIISIAQMDSARIANLIACMLNGGKMPEVATPAQQAQEQSPPTTPTAQETTKKQVGSVHITVNCGATIIGDRNIVGPGLGDIARQMQLAQRNQVLHAQQQAQQQALQQQQQQQQAQHHHHSEQTSPQQTQLPQAQQHHSPPTLKMPSPAQRRETLYQAQAAIAQHHGTLYAAQGLMSLQAPTPPMSRSGSFGSEGSSGAMKRKAEHEHDHDTGEVACKKQC